MSETGGETLTFVSPVKTLEQWASDVVAKLPDNCLMRCLTHYLASIPAAEKEKLINSISQKYLKFPLNLSLLLFAKERYWQKRCFDMNYTVVHYWFYFCNWKSTFVSLHAEEFINSFICGKISFPELTNALLSFRDHLFTLKINGFMLKYFGEHFQRFTALNGSVLFEDSIMTIIDMFPHLKELYFNNIPINYELTLDLDGDRLTDASIRRLSSTLSTRKSLQKISLIGTYMKSPLFHEMVRSFSSLENLLVLNLSCNLISDDLCEDISKLLPGSKIQKLILTNNNIGDIGAKHFASILSSQTSLNSLFLDQNVIGDDGAIHLAESVLHSFSISKLDISHNQISAQSADTFCTLLRENCSLEYLNLSGNYLGKVCGTMIYNAVKFNNNIRYLGYHFCGFTDLDEDHICLHVARNYTEATLR